MDIDALDKVLAKQDVQWQERLARMEAEEREEHPLLGVSGMFNAECDHKGHYRLVNGLHAAIRYCTQCGKSWRMWTKGDFPGECPVAEWEPIREGLEVEQRVLPDYDG